MQKRSSTNIQDTNTDEMFYIETPSVTSLISMCLMLKSNVALSSQLLHRKTNDFFFFAINKTNFFSDKTNGNVKYLSYPL